MTNIITKETTYGNQQVYMIHILCTQFQNSKGDFVLKKTVLNLRLKDLWYTKIKPSQI